MKRPLAYLFTLLCTFLLLSTNLQAQDPGSPSGNGIEAVVVAGNPDCVDLGFTEAGDFSYKPQPEPPPSGTYPFPAPDVVNDLTLSSDGTYFDWSSDIKLGAVIVKGGNNANVYYYNPEANSDTDLHSPINPNNGNPYGISHIEVCYDYNLDVSKTAQAEFTRTYNWSIDKSCDGPNSLTISTGQAFDYPFSWTASIASFTDSDWKVTGTIRVENNTPWSATVTSITDVLSGNIAATVNCGVGPDWILAPGEFLDCTYSGDLLSAADGINTVTVITSTPLVEGGTATANYTFGNPTTEIDECITVKDDCTTTTQVCQSQAPYTFEYSCLVGPYWVCGEHIFTNMASFVSHDGQDECDITVNIPCGGGCTLTPGYWKTHNESFWGGASQHADDTWQLVIPAAEQSDFFLSGDSYYGVLWTPPAGNKYYILARAYIAAYLNQLNGASVPTGVQNDLIAAATFFATYSPSQVANMKNKDLKPYIRLAGRLDAYNNGDIGPGHCDEDASSREEETALADPASSMNENIFKIYPNPAMYEVYIDISLWENAEGKLMMSDQLGKVVYQNKLSNLDDLILRIDLKEQGIQPGMYFISLTGDKGRRVEKVMVISLK